MKEATGELNMTVITVVAIAAVGAFFAVFIWPAIQTTIEQQTKCASATSCTGTGANRMCRYIDDGGKLSTDTINCPDEVQQGN